MKVRCPACFTDDAARVLRDTFGHTLLCSRCGLDVHMDDLEAFDERGRERIRAAIDRHRSKTSAGFTIRVDPTMPKGAFRLDPNGDWHDPR